MQQLDMESKTQMHVSVKRNFMHLCALWVSTSECLLTDYWGQYRTIDRK